MAKIGSHISLTPDEVNLAIRRFALALARDRGVKVPSDEVAFQMTAGVHFLPVPQPEGQPDLPAPKFGSVVVGWED